MIFSWFDYEAISIFQPFFQRINCKDHQSYLVKKNFAYDLCIRLKGQFQGQQSRGERGKKTLPAFAAHLLINKHAANAGSVQTNTLGLKIFSKFIWKI